MPKTADLKRKAILSEPLSRYIDLNTDFGQSRDKVYFEGSNYELLRYVSSVNIPCGVHDGDPKELMEAIRKAREFNCAIGAHIGYPDPQQMGNRKIDIAPEDLVAWIHGQLGLFEALCRAESANIEHIRPHGALYGTFLDDPETATLVAKTLYSMNAWTTLVAPAGPILDEIHRSIGIRVAPEIYMGKHYGTDGRLLTQRFQEDLSFQGTLDQAKQLIKAGALTSQDGKAVPMAFHTMHISPQLNQAADVAEKVNDMLGQAVPLSVVAIEGSGWVWEEVKG